MSARACGQYGFENDETRVFCQNCGARLQEGSVRAAPAARNLSAPARRAPQRKNKPKGGAFLLLAVMVREVLFTAILAAILAVLVQSVRAPDNIPPALPEIPAMASLLAADIQAAKESVYPRSLTIEPEAANNFLATRVKGAGAGGSKLRARLVRAYVIPRNNALTLGVEQSLAGHSIYLQLDYRIAEGTDGTSAVLTGGSLGRLPVPGFLAPLYSRSFAAVLDALSHPASWFSNASSVEISPSGAQVRWSGKTGS
jgi:hypothetical protein